ncbi:hypothetical protein MTBBW1_1380079 [Desulfamplus magnetovallimortis]|uniref:Uncharacterized protein n=1 Tax=Desulfamplus magnetovallimortis TaxID=1246637 RepID=A0A1W1H7T9_9BACT|nr:hypothetical protein MTBBW1_1380079 [Desulfamplus magnetovallimortis]
MHSIQAVKAWIYLNVSGLLFGEFHENNSEMDAPTASFKSKWENYFLLIPKLEGAMSSYIHFHYRRIK